MFNQITVTLVGQDASISKTSRPRFVDQMFDLDEEIGMAAGYFETNRFEGSKDLHRAAKAEFNFAHSRTSGLTLREVGAILAHNAAGALAREGKHETSFAGI